MHNLVLRLFLIGLVGLGAVQPAMAQYYPAVPPPRYQPIPPPMPGYVWQGGHWRWTGSGYVWMPGHYVLPQLGWHRWVPGHWVIRHGQQIWVPAHWR